MSRTRMKMDFFTCATAVRKRSDILVVKFLNIDVCKLAVKLCSSQLIKCLELMRTACIMIDFVNYV